VLENGGRLTLNGFTIIGQDVVCSRSCRVVGPGTITATGGVTVAAFPRRYHLTVRGVDIVGGGGLSGARVRVTDCTITDNEFGVTGADLAVVRNSTEVESGGVEKEGRRCRPSG
jgi:hypothetical protein